MLLLRVIRAVALSLFDNSSLLDWLSGRASSGRREFLARTGIGLVSFLVILGVTFILLGRLSLLIPRGVGMVVSLSPRWMKIGM